MRSKSWLEGRQVPDFPSVGSVGTEAEEINIGNCLEITVHSPTSAGPGG